MKKRLIWIFTILGVVILLIFGAYKVLLWNGMILKGEEEAYVRYLQRVQAQFQYDSYYRMSEEELQRIDSIVIHFENYEPQINEVIGLAHFLRSNYYFQEVELKASLDAIHRALGHLKQEDERSVPVADCYNVEAMLYRRLGDLDRAVTLQRLANEIYELNDYTDRFVIGFINLGVYEIHRNHPDAALQHIEKGLSALNNNVEYEARAYLACSEAYLQKGINRQNEAQPLKAKEYYTKALSYFDELERLTDSFDVNQRFYYQAGQIYRVKAELHNRLEEWGAAKKAARRSCSYLSKENTEDDQTSYGLSLAILANAMAQGDSLEAATDTMVRCMQLLGYPIKTFWDQGNGKYNNVSLKGFLLKALQYKASIGRRIYQQDNQIATLDKVFRLHQTSMRLLDSVRLGFITNESIVDAGAGYKEVFYNAAEVALSLYEKTGNSVYLEHLFAIAERGRSFALRMEMSQRSRARDLKNSREKALQQTYDSLKQTGIILSSQLLHAANTEADSTALLEKMVANRSALNAFFERLRGSDSEVEAQFYKSRIGYEIPTLQQAREAYCQDNETMVLSYFLGKAPFVLAISPGNIQAIKLKLSDSWLEDKNSFLEYCREINGTPSTFEQASGKLYEYFLAPVLDSSIWLSGPPRRLRILPDGSLRHLNFFAFKRGPNTGLPIQEWDFVGKEYAISYLYFLDSNRDDVSQRLKTDSSVAFTVSYDSMENRVTLDSLDMVASAGADNRQWSLKENCSKEQVLGLTKPQNLVYMVAHGFADASNPLKSHLLLNDASGKSMEKLSALEVYGSNLPANLLVLASCETELSSTAKGDGIATLSRALYLSGCKSLVATLYAVYDAPTAKIHKAFLQHIIDGQAIDIALQKAMLMYLNTAKGAYTRPAYWAHLVAIGQTARVN